MVKAKQKLSFEKQKATNTAFILMFPSLILTALAVYYSPLILKVVVLALSFYQFLLLKKFILDYYKVR
jgi:hypothetical protein